MTEELVKRAEAFVYPQRKTSDFVTEHSAALGIIRGLLAENARLKAAQEWQPIETAPRGVRILGLTEYGVETVWWREPISHEFYFSPSGWWGLEQDSECKPKQMQPTHWMPLPTPPEKQGEA